MKVWFTFLVVISTATLVLSGACDDDDDCYQPPILTLEQSWLDKTQIELNKLGEATRKALDDLIKIQRTKEFQLEHCEAIIQQSLDLINDVLTESPTNNKITPESCLTEENQEEWINEKRNVSGL